MPQFAEAHERDWVRNPVDAFVLAKLRAKDLRPAKPADAATLVRRVYFDLIGLPPSPGEVDAFVSDPAPDAYERLVERLLASPHYGERWGQHWLDVVRFAETEGFEYDQLRANAWRFRDYVIGSFQEDKPFDRFVREQVAGDEIDPPRTDAQVAVGFLRLGPVRRNAGNALVAFSRNEVLSEMTDTLGVALLGLTMGCARCHDHKFDAIRQTDYYHLQAFLANAHDCDVPLTDAAQQAEWKAQTDKIDVEIKQLAKAAETSSGAEREEMRRRMRELEKTLPPPLPALFSMRNEPGQPAAVHVLKRGAEDKPKELVGPRVPGVLLANGTAALDASVASPRTQFADWLVRPEHPLTARVLVNRLWLGHFGRGIVNTPNDFGVNGDLPSHPELLDFLANEFVASGWRIKPLHRLIVLSNTYRQSSTVADQATGMRFDSENRLLWKFPRQRLAAEVLRDAMLAVAGELNLKPGGPSVIVPVEQDLVDLLYKPTQWTVTPAATEHARRSVYLLAKRNLRLPFLEVFDQPTAQISCPKREMSTHAPQALELLNGSFSNEMARALARRLEREAGKSTPAQIELAFRLVASRVPTETEARLAREFLETQPLGEFALAMFNLNDFLYVK